MVENVKSIPEEHANSIGHQKAVIQNAKKGLIVAVIYRGDTEKNHYFSYVDLQNYLIHLTDSEDKYSSLKSWDVQISHLPLLNHENNQPSF